MRHTSIPPTSGLMTRRPRCPTVAQPSPPTAPSGDFRLVLPSPPGRDPFLAVSRAASGSASGACACSHRDSGRHRDRGEPTRGTRRTSERSPGHRPTGARTRPHHRRTHRREPRARANRARQPCPCQRRCDGSRRIPPSSKPPQEITRHLHIGQLFSNCSAS